MNKVAESKALVQRERHAVREWETATRDSAEEPRPAVERH